MKSKIEWTGRTLEVTGGCSECSPGCRGCFARGLIWRFAHKKGSQHDKYRGLVEKVNGKLRWTGKIVLFREHLEQPLKRKKPTTYFVDSRSDLFHPGVNIGWLTHIFDTIEQCPQHTFQILTKRPEQALKMMWGRHEDNNGWRYFAETSFHPNIWFGVTVCNQEEADKKIPILLQIPAAVRFVSIEPMLGAIDIRPYLPPIVTVGKNHRLIDRPKEKIIADQEIHQVIVGGESGPGARPMHPDWARGIRDQCVAAGVPFFFKQWGEWIAPGLSGPLMGGIPSPSCKLKSYTFPGDGHFCKKVYRVGKKKAGCLLDGKSWSEYPKGGE